MTKLTSRFTTGVTRITAGKAMVNAKNQAFNQRVIILETKPILKSVITSDIMHDISKAMKNEKT